MLKLKGQTESGKWVEFNISQVYDICLHDNRWYIKGYPNDYVIDPATIQLAADPRRAMLDEIRKWLGYVQRVEDKVNGWGGYSEDEVDAILDEMEAKL